MDREAECTDCGGVIAYPAEVGATQDDLDTYLEDNTIACPDCCSDTFYATGQRITA